MKSRNENGMGYMRQRKDGRYELVHVIEYSDGTKKKKSFYGKSKSEANRKYEEFLKNLSVMPSINSSVMVYEYMIKYFLPYKKMYLKEDSYNRLVKTIEYQIKPYIGNIAMQKLSKYHVLGMLADLNKKGYSLSTRKKAYNAVNAACKFALGDLIMKNPCDKVQVPKKAIGMNKPIVFLNNEEIIIFKNEAFRQYKNGAFVYGKNRWALLLQLQTGMRPGEVCGVLLGDIIFGQNNTPDAINVQHKAIDPQDKVGNITEKTKAKIVNSVKTDTSNRIISLTNEGRNAVLALINENVPRKKFDPLIVNKKGEVLAPKDLTRTFNRIVKATHGKIPAYKMGAHTLRRTFASQMYERGYDIKFTSELLGHTSVQMTLDFYTGLSKMGIKKKLETFDNI